MINFAKKVLTICLLVVCFSQFALAEKAPKQLVGEILKEFKQKKDPVILMKHVHWPTAFEKTDDRIKQQFKINSPKDLEAYYKQVLSDPGVFMREQMKVRLAQVPPQHHDMMESQINGLITVFENKIKEMQAKVGRTEYSIEDEKIEGDTAVIKVKREVDGETKHDDVNLVKVDGEWYLETVESANSLHKEEARSGEEKAAAFRAMLEQRQQQQSGSL